MSRYTVELTWPQIEALREAAAFRLAGEREAGFDVLERAKDRLDAVRYRPNSGAAPIGGQAESVTESVTRPRIASRSVAF